MQRKILVTSALPNANGPIHLGHMLEQIQTDIWVRYQKSMGNKVIYVCADDTHGTATMLKAEAESTTPEELVEKVRQEHLLDSEKFLISFDNYFSTHSEENREFSELIFNRLDEQGLIFKKNIEQFMIFSTLKCGSCIVNNNKINDLHVLILTPFWVSFWRCFGSPNGGQGHQKATSKKHQKNDAQNEPKLVPKGVPKWSQNRQK